MSKSRYRQNSFKPKRVTNITTLVLCCICFISMFPLAGCWDIKNVQDINYITAIGIDHVNDKFVVYSQSLNFSNVAKQEGMRATSKTPEWIGRGEGFSLDAAVNDIYSASSLKILWEHTTAIILSEKALQQNVNKMLDTLLRYYGIRYTPWVYGTKESLSDLFTVPIPFNMSPITSILHNPEDMFKQHSYIRPIQLHRMVVEMNEPGSTLLLPSMSVNHNHWQENEKKVGQYKIDGAFALQEGTYRNWFAMNHIHGIRWLSSKTVQTPLNIGRGEKPDAVLTMTTPKSNIAVTFRGLIPKFNVSIHVNGFVDEITGNLSEAEIISLAEQSIRDEVKKTFEQGLRKKMDVFSFRNYVYRNHINKWKREGNGKSIQLTPDSLDSLNVKVQIEHSGMNRLHR
ncbi:Ger(x)C family spore germination protein [Paenibacillus sp. OSY-SE]|uniref:Ger(x)C family spore germination protein n=1 Tax=Paenibacillus sp. OSY-SE TaxID=1196323 RepID=UPI000308F218|nr:Ger(x)C family spore germination protein [Paenibacillus sp. OSY-SE]